MGRGVARYGRAWRGEARHGSSIPQWFSMQLDAMWLGQARRGSARLGAARRGVAWQGSS